MKFTSKHLESLKIAIIESDINIKEMKLKYNIEGKSETRFLWDLFWMSKWTKKEHKHYYEGDYNDSHIQTAIKSIVKELTN
jgi:hypothetical protein